MFDISFDSAKSLCGNRTSENNWLEAWAGYLLAGDQS